MKKAAVIIGIERTAKLPPLPAAVPGAKKFAQWANCQGFDCTLLTDEDSRVVLSAITSAITSYISQRTYEQLIVHFSGHGVTKGTHELWLLSDAVNNPAEAVNVPLSSEYARNAGIKHIIFISDACRSFPNTLSLLAVTGSPIFASGRPTPNRPFVDIFYATLQGDPAYEVPASEVAGDYHAIFTSCLLRALSDINQGATETRFEPPPKCQAVTSSALKYYLEQSVPETAEEMSLKLIQYPDIRVESRLPLCLTEFAVSSEEETTLYAAIPEDPEGDISIQFRKVSADPKTNEKEKSRWTHMMPSTIRSAFEGNFDAVYEAEGRRTFETRTGYSVIGARIKSASINDCRLDIFEEKGAQHIRVNLPNGFESTRYGSCSILMEFEGGTGTILAVIPECIGTVVVEKGKVIDVAYVPSGNTNDYYAYMDQREEIKARHALVASLARYGQLTIPRENANELAEYLRPLKFYDPSLGVYASYAYWQTGNQEEIRSIFHYMEHDRKVIPFDVALLARETESTSRIAPFCPMISQGWALLDFANPLFPDLNKVLKELRAHLIPSLWTTLNREGIRVAQQIIHP